MKTTILIASILILSLQYGTAQSMNKKVFENIPTTLREKATVAFVGTFYTGRGACQTYAEGKRRWRLIKGFKIEDDLIGNIKIKEIEIDPNLANDSINSKIIEIKMMDGDRYCVLLNPSSEKLKYISDNKIPFDFYNHLLSKEEIIAIIKIK
jgi:hypothetical protein